MKTIVKVDSIFKPIAPHTPERGDIYMKISTGDLYVIAIVNGNYYLVNITTGCIWCGGSHRVAIDSFNDDQALFQFIPKLTLTPSNS